LKNQAIGYRQPVIEEAGNHEVVLSMALTAREQGGREGRKELTGERETIAD
jgi:hypothetical protein